MDSGLVIEAGEAAWADRASVLLAQALQAAVEEGGQALLAVAGGTTPAPILRRLARQPIPWRRIAVTLTDERRVAADAPESNERLVRETLLAGPAAVAAFAPLRQGPVTPPPDAVLLGMGEDGHIASIFPGDPQMGALLDTRAQPACLAVPKGHGVPPPQPRLSLNLAALAGAGRIVLAIRGEAKRQLYARATAGGTPDLPVARLMASEARLVTVWSE
ncbi:MAG TPA: 6-phosphogluconolactonase [Caulobacteraceae bacterium]|nr:6-phosphogluconolactonase [Caulobacteraceae bacterium]